jgi:hypothetical protein
MRLRLLMRRLTVSAPRMAVHSALPWPFRWAMLAIVFGFCAAIALWAFEFGKDIAGLDRGNKEQLQQAHLDNATLRDRVDVLTEERNKAQLATNTVDTVLTAGKVEIDKLIDQNKLLALENQRLKSDLGFFEQLIPTSAGNAGQLAIRGLQAEMLPSGEIKWQVLVIQGSKNPAEFDGQLELVFTGLLNAKPWTVSLLGGSLAIKVKQYGRLEGVYQPPAQMIVKTVIAKVLQGQTVRAVQTAKLL